MSFWDRLFGRTAATPNVNSSANAAGTSAERIAKQTAPGSGPLESFTRTLSPEAFTALVVQRIGIVWPHSSVRVLETLSVQVQGPGMQFPSGTLGLFELWRGFDAHLDRGPRDLHGEVDTWLRKVLSPVATTPLTVEAKRRMVRPLIKSADFVIGARQEGLDLLTLPVAGDLHLAFAFDLGETLEFVTAADATAFAGVDISSLAYENLATDGLNIEVHGPGPHVMVTCGGNFEASLLLDSRVITAVAERLAGELVACVPTRVVLIFGGTGDPASIAALRSGRDALFDRHADRLISRCLLIRRGASWQVFEAPGQG